MLSPKASVAGYCPRRRH